ncbi:CHAD domain-containing protein [Halopseudomonas salina]|uniref:CHAD domain-containing protein n=1 Tax=Halopseudomonas salina TaxID=1323744 RepID=A0ABQ1P1R6_9GAMM|nr:CHAD domain-containing protein [Halopseudomonas salina]GGC88963.1 CHAD domain-containing protein [Halopseudomonas salina]
MAYRIKPRKSATKQVRRVALERLHKARKALMLPPQDRARGIHQARKRLKEVRALIRLVRKPLGETFKEENRRFRNINRKLSSMRDAGALIEIWDILADAEPERFASQEKRDVRQRLVVRGQDGGQTVEESHQILNEVIEDLAKAEDAVAAWPAKGETFALVSDGLKRTTADGRRALEAACDSVSDDRLHDWRKRVKDHWYHTRLLKSAWPAALDARTAMLKDLADLLGQDHDLSMLQTMLDKEPTLFGSAQQREELLEIAGKRRDELQHSAFRLGLRLYAESPAALCKRWGRYWKIARAEKT